MFPSRRVLLKVVIAAEDRQTTRDLVESLMGRKPELRYQFIQDRAKTAVDVDV